MSRLPINWKIIIDYIFESENLGAKPQLSISMDCAIWGYRKPQLKPFRTGTLLRRSISQGPRDSGKSRALQQRHPDGILMPGEWWTPGHATIACDTFSNVGYV